MDKLSQLGYPLSPEIMAEDLFKESLRQHQLPTKLTPDILTEALRHPKHFPSVNKLLALFQTSPLTTQQTEQEAKYCPDIKRTVSSIYERELESGTAKKSVYSHDPTLKRLKALCVSHDIVWRDYGDGQKALYLLEYVLAPRLGLDFKSNKGDYHLIVKWLIDNMQQLNLIFFDDGSIEALAAKISQLRYVKVNHSKIEALLQAWEKEQAIDLEVVRIKKSKITSPQQEFFPRAGQTSISQKFQRLFVDFDPTNKAEVTNFLEISETEVSDDILIKVANKMMSFQIIMLALLEDDPNNEYKPLELLAKRLKEPLDYFLKLTTQYLRTAPEKQTAFANSTIDPKLDQRTLDQTLAAITSKIREERPGNFHIGRALLIYFTQLKTENDSRADDVEKLMYYLNQMAEGKS